MICLTKLFQQKRRRIGYILAFSDPTISKRDSSDIKYIGKQRKSVAKTVSGYNLEGKLKDSQKLCMEIVADSVIFSDMPVFFLLVTDIDVKSHGIEALAEMLDVLGETSTDIYSQCISESGKVLDSEILIGHKYIYCKEFDKVMATL